MLGIRRAGALALVLLAGVDAKLSITKGKAVVTSGTGSEDVFQLKNDVFPSPIALDGSSTLKLSFNIQDDSKGIAPNQAFIVFSDVVRDEDVTLRLGVKDNGRTNFYIDSARPPAALAATSGKLKATVLLCNGADAFRTTLGEITLPQSVLIAAGRKRHDLPPRVGEPAFSPLPEITHTFQPDPKVVPAAKGILGAVAVMAPWLTLLALVSNVYPSLTFLTPGGVMYAWFGSLIALEALILSYWIGLKLYQLLPAFIGLSSVSAYVGIVALRHAREARLRAGGKS